MRERMDVPWSEIRLARSPRGKPYLAAPLQGTCVSLNVSKNAELTSQPVMVHSLCVVDVLRFESKPQHCLFAVYVFIHIHLICIYSRMHACICSCLAFCHQVGPDSNPHPLGWSFNLSHQGDYAVLAAEQGLQVGVDVMKTTMPGNNTFRSNSYFSAVILVQFLVCGTKNTQLGRPIDRSESLPFQS